MFRIALVSDTHDLLRPELLAFLQGSDHIVHAGDICGPEVLRVLPEMAPLTAVRPAAPGRGASSCRSPPANCWWTGLPSRRGS